MLSFFSSGYLDVSVHPVSFSYLWIQYEILEVRLKWVPPFGYLRIKARLQLPGAFRRSLRPSSPPYAKASSVCPCSLDLAKLFLNCYLNLISSLCSFQGAK